MNTKQFRVALVEQLTASKTPTPKGRKRSASVVSKNKPQVSTEKRRTGASHLPVYGDTSKRRRCAHCSTKNNQQRTQWLCKTCNVPLCITSTRNCFYAYHV